MDWVGFRAMSTALLLVGFACGDDSSPGDGGPGTDAAATECTSDATCDDGAFCNGTERCDPGTAGANDLGCVAGTDPCAGSRCVEADSACDCTDPDADGDGAVSIACGGDDCDDANADRYPGNTELCDSTLDDDCDPTTLGDDNDGDGFTDAVCCNMTVDGLLCGDDCDDSLSGVNPGTPEACNGEDDNCNGLIDEGVTTTCHADADNDGFAPDGAETIDQCISCTETDNWASAPRSPAEFDCDDSDATIRPGATELCDNIDSDCSDGGAFPAPDEDADEDGYASVLSSCTGGPIPKLDCNDRDDRVRPNTTTRYHVPHCTGGAEVGCFDGSEWSCRYPQGRSESCNMSGGVLPGSSAPSWDFNCNATLEPEDAHRGCSCTAGQCGEIPMGGGGFVTAGPAQGPALTPAITDCGRLVPSTQCLAGGVLGGTCGGLGGTTCNVAGSAVADFFVRCR